MRKKVLKKSLVQSIVLDDVVWKVHLGGERLLVETREGRSKRFNLHCIAVRTAEALWKMDETSLNWWETVAAITDRYIALSAYQDPAFPYTGGVKVLDLSDSRVLWENKTYRALGLKTSDALLVSSSEAGDASEVWRVGLDTGEVQEKVGIHEIGDWYEQVNPELSYPAFYPEGHAYFDQVADFLKLRGFYPVKAIEYVEIDGKIVMGFYQEEERMLRFSLLIVNDMGDELWRDSGINQSEGIGFGMYFLLKEWVVFVRDKKEIVILNLSI